MQFFTRPKRFSSLESQLSWLNLSSTLDGKNPTKNWFVDAYFVLTIPEVNLNKKNIFFNKNITHWYPQYFLNTEELIFHHRVVCKIMNWEYIIYR